MQTNNYEALQLKAGTTKKVDDMLVVEAALQININNDPYTVVMRTPDHDDELIRGLLFAEDIYKSQEKIKLDLIESAENGFFVVNATIPKSKLGKGYLNKRTLLSVSSCGICGKQKLEDNSVTGEKLTSKISFDTKKQKQMFSEMLEKQETFADWCYRIVCTYIGKTLLLRHLAFEYNRKNHRICFIGNTSFDYFVPVQQIQEQYEVSFKTLTSRIEDNDNTNTSKHS